MPRNKVDLLKEMFILQKTFSIMTSGAITEGMGGTCPPNFFTAG